MNLRLIFWTVFILIFFLAVPHIIVHSSTSFNYPGAVFQGRFKLSPKNATFHSQKSKLHFNLDSQLGEVKIVAVPVRVLFATYGEGCQQMLSQDICSTPAINNSIDIIYGFSQLIALAHMPAENFSIILRSKVCS
jgi:hypothetical protein